MPARTIFSLDDLPQNIAKIFDQAQSTTANHQKNLVALHKLQIEAAALTEPVKNTDKTRFLGEKAFNNAFLDMLIRVMPVKKGATVADRIMKFVGSYIKFMLEKAEEQKRAEQSDEDEETMSSRFINKLLGFFLEGFKAKDKIVRYRAVQLIAELTSHLGSLDSDVYEELRSNLLERIRDKESTVRVQAALALCKICDIDDAESSPTIEEVLIESLTYDTSPDVRRAILVNIPAGPATMPALLSRTRDVDAAVRRSVYSVVLNPEAPGRSEDNIANTHPRSLTISQRELIVRHGLGDREETVKAAAINVLTSWMDIVEEQDNVSQEEEGGDEQPKEKEKKSSVLKFLALFDLFQTSIPEDALLSVFTARPDVLDSLEFSNDFWKTLTPEKAFLVRVFADHCVAIKDDARLEAALPVVGIVAGKIGTTYNELQKAAGHLSDDGLLRDGMDDPDWEEEKAKTEDAQWERECVMSELLKLAMCMDYGDEIGRRMMNALVRDLIGKDALPESLVARCLDVIRKLCSGERDLIRIVVEVVHELRDPEDEDDAGRSIQKDRSGADDGATQFGETPATVKTVRALPKPASEMSPEEKARADAMDLRCLSLCIGMLERVNSRFEDNSTLEGVLGELIVPAVKRKELALREKGLVALGLCCLIARRMALSSFQLFLSQVHSAPEVLKLRVLQIVFDILMVNEGDFLGPGSTNGERIIEFILHVLENEESEKVQALLCVGISKLMLSGMITEEKVLKSLVLVYMSPETADNQELRQCLTYFFPVYCFSSPANQKRMQQIFADVYVQLCQVHKDSDDDEEIITLLQAGLMFVDWTDPQKASVIVKQVPGQEIDESIHIDLANDIIKTLFSDELTKDEKKSLCQLLGKLHIPETIDDDKIRTLKLLMHNIRARRPIRDAASRNAFTKFEIALNKKFEKQLEAFNEEEYRQLEQLKGLFEFLDDIIPLSDDEEEAAPKKKGARKRRSESVTTDASSVTGFSGDERSSVGSRTSKGKAKPKRRRLSQSDDESDGDDKTERGNSPAVISAPTRVMPRRSAAVNAKKAVAMSVQPPDSSSEDEDDEDEERVEETPPPPRRRVAKPPSSRASTSAKPRSRRSAETPVDDEEENDSILNQTHDSIMDTTMEVEDDEDEDADEVEDIL
ncbi:hypothetical protein EIP91_000246 [Steccherinum ochraceum]|uniref:Nuclear condensin complex subunit 3 C-terminal domain-containing protein n=1 Tax=Steccherinum ochraceum TaxID=92696 RepID=A0A4R0RMS4_9APHY|nr:hypothetical protein EIP91_000246 [Steccherinum ochraceum]